MRSLKILVFIGLAGVCYLQPLKAQWTIQHSGLPASLNPTLAFSAVDSNVCWAFQGSVVKPIVNPKCLLTTDGGDHWSPVQLPDIPGVTLQSLFAYDMNTAWIALDEPSGTTSGGIFKTVNGGTDWVKQGTAFPGAGGHPLTIYFFDANNGLCTGEPRSGYCEIYTTADGGANWIRVPSANIPAVAADDIVGWGKGTGDRFWFQTGSCSVFITTDKGHSWSVARNVFPPPAFFTSVDFKNNSDGVALSYYGDGVNKVAITSNGGTHWTRIPIPVSQPSTGFITFIPGTIGTYFVTCHKNIGYQESTIPGSMVTNDGGLTWQNIDSLPHGPSSFISNRTGWSAGCGDTIFKWKSKFPLGIGDIGPLNESANLCKAYPNPFSSSTSIQYRVPGSSNVMLIVYDFLGSEVAVLVNEEKAAGSYEVKFESRGLKPGIYYLRLQVGAYLQTNKLCIL